MKLLHQLKYFKIDSESPHFRDVNYSPPPKKIVFLQNRGGGILKCTYDLNWQFIYFVKISC